MIFVTGDTHSLKDVKKLDKENFPMQDRLTRDDYLIIAGDFGGIWYGNEKDEETLAFYESKPYTVLFVAGNHENHAALAAYPEEEWNGGMIHRIRDNIIHLMNGHIFEIEGKSIFVMGGATSVDKAYRTEGQTWWPEEEPAEEVLEFAAENLRDHGHSVDYVITHTCPEMIRKGLVPSQAKFVDYESRVEQFLDLVLDHVSYKRWYLGHIHVDLEIRDFDMKILFDDIERLR